MSNTHPKVSVVIPAYNHEKYIAGLLQSILEQTMQDFEVIIIDDASPDSTAEIIQIFADEYPNKIKFFRQANQGLVKTVNKAFKLCRGKYIAPVGSDDIWGPNMLEEQLKKIEQDPELSIVYSDLNFIDSHNKILGRLHKSVKPYSGIITQNLWLTNFISGVAVMYKRELFEKFGYWDEKYSIGSDFEFLLRVSPFIKIGYVDQVLANYRIHQDCSSLGNEQTGLDALAIRQQFVQNNPGLISKKLLKLGYAHAYFLIAEANSINKNKNRAFKFYLKACINNPKRLQPYLGLFFSLAGFNYFKLKQTIKNKIYVRVSN